MSLVNDFYDAQRAIVPTDNDYIEKQAGETRASFEFMSGVVRNIHEIESVRENVRRTSHHKGVTYSSNYLVKDRKATIEMEDSEGIKRTLTLWAEKNNQIFHNVATGDAITLGILVAEDPLIPQKPNPLFLFNHTTGYQQLPKGLSVRPGSGGFFGRIADYGIKMPLMLALVGFIPWGMIGNPGGMTGYFGVLVLTMILGAVLAFAKTSDLKNRYKSSCSVINSAISDGYETAKTLFAQYEDVSKKLQNNKGPVSSDRPQSKVEVVDTPEYEAASTQPSKTSADADSAPKNTIRYDASESQALLEALPSGECLSKEAPGDESMGMKLDRHEPFYVRGVERRIVKMEKVSTGGSSSITEEYYIDRFGSRNVTSVYGSVDSSSEDRAIYKCEVHGFDLNGNAVTKEVNGDFWQSALAPGDLVVFFDGEFRKGGKRKHISRNFAVWNHSQKARICPKNWNGIAAKWFSGSGLLFKAIMPVLGVVAGLSIVASIFLLFMEPAGLIATLPVILVCVGIGNYANHKIQGRYEELGKFADQKLEQAMSEVASITSTTLQEPSSAET